MMNIHVYDRNYLSVFFFFSIVCITYLSEENNGQVFLWLINGKKRFSRLKNNYFVCELLDVASGVRRPASGVRRPASGVRRPA